MSTWRKRHVGCAEKRFGDVKTLQPVEWLLDYGSCYTAIETITLAAALDIVSKFTPARSLQRNSMTEALVKAFKWDLSSAIIGQMGKP